MASSSSKSVSRSKTSRNPDEIRLLADQMLKASLSRSTIASSDPLPSDNPLPIPISSASLSRSTSRDDHRSLADQMLKASLSRSTIASSDPLPSDNPLPIPISSVSLSRSTSRDDRRLLADTTFQESLTRPPSYRSSISRERSTGSSIRDVKSRRVETSSTSKVITAADAKARILKLNRDMQAEPRVPRNSTKSLFRETCSTDVLFLIDTTGSMGSYINAAKEQVNRMVADIKKTFLNEADVRIAVVSYKDHDDHPNIEFLDFTTSTVEVSRFLGHLSADGGGDLPEDVLGGIHQALQASWKHRTRCMFHIADAPPHGAGVLHDLTDYHDQYSRPGSEPHGYTHGHLLKRLVQLQVTYALLRINSYTDRMAFAFAQVYAASSAEVKLLPTNPYASQVTASHFDKFQSIKRTNFRFVETELGTSYSELQHLVVTTVTASVTRTTSNESLSLAKMRLGGAHGKFGAFASDLSSVREDSDSFAIAGLKEISLEKGDPQWDNESWFDKTLELEGYCPDMVLQSADSLNAMMAADENIKLGVTQLIVHMRSKPFGKGSIRFASYAHTANSTSKFAVKPFQKDGNDLFDVIEDMRIQAICKAFALEFNGLLKIEPPIDFVITTGLKSKETSKMDDKCLSLEPFIEGKYVKYNNNEMFVKEDDPGEPDLFNQIAQAFSHFTYERSWGLFLVNDLQGVGHLLTDPSIQTKDPNRFTRSDTNIGEDSFKFFFAVHKCNTYCRKLELESNGEMLASDKLKFRERWPALEPTLCCSNKLCRQIIGLGSVQDHESDEFPGYHWCKACYSQLRLSTVQSICNYPGPEHEFEVSRFFHESQGRFPPDKCPDHTEKDKSLSSTAVVGGSPWDRMKAEGSKVSISGRAW